LSFAIPPFKAIGSDAHFQLLLVLHGAEAGIRQKSDNVTMTPDVTIIIRLAPSCNVHVKKGAVADVELRASNHLSAEIAAEDTQISQKKGCRSELHQRTAT